MTKYIILWHHLSRRRQKQFLLIIILMFLASIFEVVSVGAVLPFLGVLTAPEELYQHSLMQPFIQKLQLTSPSQLLLPFTAIFIFAALISGFVRLLLLYSMTKFSHATGADLGINIYRRTLYQEYKVHIEQNSSKVINGIIAKTNTVIGGVISPILSLISSTVFIIFIMTALFTIDKVIALVSSVGFGGLYWAVIRYTRHQLKENSQCIADQSTQIIKSLQEGLGGIRDVLIDGSQEFYCKLYREADLPLRKASGMNTFISGSPRFVMEAIGISLIAGVAYFMSLREDGLIAAIPVLGALALGAQRLLPALQQAYGSYSTIKGSQSSFGDVLDLLDQPLPEYSNLSAPIPTPFDQEIRLIDVCFRYGSEESWVFDKVNLVIPKGSRIGFVGTTGGGKSTLLDIIMGLLAPTSGSIFIDQKLITSDSRRSWQANIAHVPQNIYLSDSSIEENIAFGTPKNEINHGEVKKAAQQAQIADLIAEWRDGYQTLVGERGVRLSGGQRQRIGIARALYKQANVLILDEATSALDDETESAVMEVIEGLSQELTILIIAHRLTTLKNCDKIVKIDKNSPLYIVDYKDLRKLDNEK